MGANNSGYSGTGTSSTGSGMGSGTGHHGSTGTTGTKPSLMDKLNPMKDADHDGKKGLMK